MRTETEEIAKELEDTIEHHGAEIAQRMVRLVKSAWAYSKDPEWLEELIAVVEALDLDASELRAARRSSPSDRWMDSAPARGR